MRRRVLAAVVAVVVLAGCALSGSLSFYGRQSIRGVLGEGNNVVLDCFAYPEQWMDLGIATVRVRSRVSYTSCPMTDWTQRTVVMSCFIGASTCGGPWRLNTTNPITESTFRFTRVPNGAKLRVTSTFTLANKVTRMQVGDTPTIKCSEADLACKFQT